MIGLIAGLFGTLGSAFSSFMGFKSQQGQIVQSALQTIATTNSSDAEYNAASARAIEALYSNGPPIERLWRPCLMWLIMAMLVARWFFGYTPPYITQMELSNIYQWLYIGLIGYMPLRSFEKIATMFNIGSILKTYIGKTVG